jgi:hypothetical protein
MAKIFGKKKKGKPVKGNPNVKRYLINHLLSTIPKQTIFCLSFPSRERATAPG